MRLSTRIHIPINSFSRVPPSNVRVQEDPDVGKRWGSASSFRFQGPESEDPENPQDTGGVRPLEDEIIERRGTECLWVREVGTDVGEENANNGLTTGSANSEGDCEEEGGGTPHPPTKNKDLPGYPGAGNRPAEPWTFFCGTFIEETEERKKNGSVIEVTPIITTVYLYVTWPNAQYLFIWPTAGGNDPKQVGRSNIVDIFQFFSKRAGIPPGEPSQIFIPDVVIKAPC